MPKSNQHLHKSKLLHPNTKSYEQHRLSILEYFLDHIKEELFLLTNEGRFMYVNQEVSRALGYTRAELQNMCVADIDPNYQISRFTEAWEALKLTGSQIFETQHIAKNGNIISVEVQSNYFLYDGLEYNFAVVKDISECKLIKEKTKYNEIRLNEAQRIAKIGSWEYTFSDLTLTFSDEMYRIFEIVQTSSHASYQEYFNTIHPEDRITLETVFDNSVQNKLPYEIIHRLLMSDGRIKYIEERGKTIYDESGNPIRSIGTVQDITERKIFEKQIEFMTHHDSLTGLPNHTLAKVHTEKSIDKAQCTHSKLAILFIDLDGFKNINDSLGHSMGDLLLKMIASRLMEVIEINDILSRQGGDEFLLILSDIKEINDVINISKILLNVFEDSFQVHNHFLSLSASIGISLYPDHGENFETLFQCADTAMYKAKEQGKNGYCFYTQQMNHNMIGQFKLQNDLKSALQNNEFILHYQPQIDLSNNSITGVEALIRWHHPMLGMIPPMSFIPIAESSGLIVQIGQWVIEEACAQAALWHRRGIEISVAVNISAVQFRRGDLEMIILKALTQSGLNSRYLELELTESIMMHDIEVTLQTVHNLKELGIQLSIDDFGTGYSSLAYLKRFAVDKLKIDQSFVRDILNDQEDAAIVQTIIQMGKTLKLKTIAEGVEDANALALIDSYGCDEVQGYHFAEPLEASEFETYYKKYVI